MVGYKPEEIKDEFDSWIKLLHPKYRKEVVNYAQEYVKSAGKEEFEMEFKMRHKDGHWVDILARAFMAIDKKGKPIRMVGTHVDITERKRVEAKLNDKLSELNKMNQLMVGRELKMIELKQEVIKLKNKQKNSNEDVFKK